MEEEQTFYEFCKKNENLLSEFEETHRKISADLIKVLYLYSPIESGVCLGACLNTFMFVCEKSGLTTQQLRELFQECLIRYDERISKKD